MCKKPMRGKDLENTVFRAEKKSFTRCQLRLTDMNISRANEIALLHFLWAYLR